jgi:ribosomal protein S2
MFKLTKKSHAVDFTLGQLIAAGVQLGHREKRVDQRMFEVLQGARLGVYIVDLAKSIRAMKPALSVVTALVAKRRRIIFANVDARVFSLIPNLIKNFCLRYFTLNRKLPGVLTNFLHLRKTILSLKLSKQFPSFAAAFSSYDHHILWESNLLNLPSLGIFDSDTNSSGHSFYAVPGNDDSFGSRFLYYNLLFSSIRNGFQRHVLLWGMKKSAKLKIIFNFLAKYLLSSDSLFRTNFFLPNLSKIIGISSSSKARSKKKKNCSSTNPCKFQLLQLFYLKIVKNVVDNLVFNSPLNYHISYQEFQFFLPRLYCSKIVNTRVLAFKQLNLIYNFNIFNFFEPVRANLRYKLLKFVAGNFYLKNYFHLRLNFLKLKYKIHKISKFLSKTNLKVAPVISKCFELDTCTNRGSNTTTAPSRVQKTFLSFHARNSFNIENISSQSILLKFTPGIKSKTIGASPVRFFVKGLLPIANLTLSKNLIKQTISFRLFTTQRFVKNYSTNFSLAKIELKKITSSMVILRKILKISEGNFWNRSSSIEKSYFIQLCKDFFFMASTIPSLQIYVQSLFSSLMKKILIDQKFKRIVILALKKKLKIENFSILSLYMKFLRNNLFVDGREKFKKQSFSSLNFFNMSKKKIDSTNIAFLGLLKSFKNRFLYTTRQYKSKLKLQFFNEKLKVFIFGPKSTFLANLVLFQRLHAIQLRTLDLNNLNLKKIEYFKKYFLYWTNMFSKNVLNIIFSLKNGLNKKALTLFRNIRVLRIRSNPRSLGLHLKCFDQNSYIMRHYYQHPELNQPKYPIFNFYNAKTSTFITKLFIYQYLLRQKFISQKLNLLKKIESYSDKKVRDFKHFQTMVEFKPFFFRNVTQRYLPKFVKSPSRRNFLEFMFFLRLFNLPKKKIQITDFRNALEKFDFNYKNIKINEINRLRHNYFPKKFSEVRYLSQTSLKVNTNI